MEIIEKKYEHTCMCGTKVIFEKSELNWDFRYNVFYYICPSCRRKNTTDNGTLYFKEIEEDHVASTVTQELKQEIERLETELSRDKQTYQMQLDLYKIKINEVREDIKLAINELQPNELINGREVLNNILIELDKVGDK